MECPFLVFFGKRKLFKSWICIFFWNDTFWNILIPQNVTWSKVGLSLFDCKLQMIRAFQKLVLTTMPLDSWPWLSVCDAGQSALTIWTLDGWTDSGRLTSDCPLRDESCGSEAKELPPSTLDSPSRNLLSLYFILDLLGGQGSRGLKIQMLTLSH